MRYRVMSRPATSILRVRWGRENPSYTGQMCVTPSPLSITIPVSSPGRREEREERGGREGEREGGEGGRRGRGGGGGGGG